MKRLGADDQAALKKAQRAWLAFRDADCEVCWADRRDCMIARTDEREEQFKTSTYFDGRGKLIELR
ncbi:lysozyme inhibitor LprI family protein [Novosphingobium sp.]|uniref:lysozyme inhibitor LprI family protein n=1 Tax=Novosphingobium sp. TaxID=1874826 RepID=UPI00333F95FB